ncbi:MAG TPA: diguanylate cyclase [Candidatus Acidoferrum sp.]|nr:diguanylate cyclase [Candidatus Acidoferrum sp.]
MTKIDIPPTSRILIAEDDPVLRRMLEAMLVKAGYDVVTVADGKQALHILESEDAPSLAILDWVMPGMEGPQVCERIRQRRDRPYVYILLLTALTQKGNVLHGLESGADDYLTKPFDAQELRARVRVGLRILGLQQSLISAREELRFQATHDALTGVLNRGAVLETIHRERSRQAREGGALGIILADLDHFKHVNDTYGHLFGDAVLKETARRMISCVRPYDTVGRYGGEEFLIVAPTADSMGSLSLAERMREAIASNPIATASGAVNVTASFGVAASDSQEMIAPEVLLLRVDDALYRAKERGRNRCELARASATTTSGLIARERTPEPAR